MPLMQCTLEGKKGWKYGDSGHCYTYSDDASEKVAKKQAIKQAIAIGGGKVPPEGLTETNIQDLYRLHLGEHIAAGDTTPMMVFPIGTFHSAKYPDLEFTEDLANELIANFEAGILGREPVVDSSGRHDVSAPAAGWVKRVYLASYEEGDVTGMALWADVKWTALGAQLLSDDEYKYGSVEIGMVVMNQSGAEVPNVLRSLTLCNTPVLSIMPAVKDAKAAQTMAVVATLSEYSLEGNPEDDDDDQKPSDATPWDGLLAMVNALPAHAKLALKGQKGNTAIHAGIAKLCKDVQDFCDGLKTSESTDPATRGAGRLEPDSPGVRPVKGTHDASHEDDGPIAPKGADHMNTDTLKKLNLTEDATDEVILAEVVKLIDRAEAAEAKTAEAEKATRRVESEAKLAEAIKDTHVLPAEKDALMALAEASPEAFEATLEARKTVKLVDVTEHGNAGHEGKKEMAEGGVTADPPKAMADAISTYMSVNHLKGLKGQDEARAALKISDPQLFSDYAAYLSEQHIGGMSPTGSDV
ncbi:MAG: phage protease [Candidatus Limnocylindrales bacterium]